MAWLLLPGVRVAAGITRNMPSSLLEQLAICQPPHTEDSVEVLRLCLKSEVSACLDCVLKSVLLVISDYGTGPVGCACALGAAFRICAL